MFTPGQLARKLKNAPGVVENGGQLIQRQHGSGVAGSTYGIGMRLDKETIHRDGCGRPRHHPRQRRLASGTISETARTLQTVRNIKNNRVL